MRLRGKMEDGVDLFRFQHVNQEVAALDVTPNKLWSVVVSQYTLTEPGYACTWQDS